MMDVLNDDAITKTIEFWNSINKTHGALSQH
jgi:hypothetical protein